jgi:uncharacterized RDD family membrane protein YckC
MPAVPIGADSSFCSECGRPFPTNQLVAIGNANVCAQCKPVYLQRMREGGQAIGARRYAGFWIRFVAIIIDGVILGIINWIIRLPLVAIIGAGTLGAAGSGSVVGVGAILAAGGLLTLVGLAVGIAYQIYFLTTRGATPGKMALGLKVIRADGGPISAGLALGRYLAQILSALIFGIGYIIAGFDSEKRSLHDRICDTRVIYVK